MFSKGIRKAVIAIRTAESNRLDLVGWNRRAEPVWTGEMKGEYFDFLAGVEQVSDGSTEPFNKGAFERLSAAECGLRKSLA